jgi:hypothetical protein
VDIYGMNVVPILSLRLAARSAEQADAMLRLLRILLPHVSRAGPARAKAPSC